MIIDGHAHAARKFADAERLIEILDNHGIDKVALCPSLKNNTDLSDPPGILPLKKRPQSFYFLNCLCKFSYRYIIKDMGDGNKFVYSLYQKYPERIIQFYWLNPLDADFMEQLQGAYRNWNIRGIKLHQACNPFTNDSPEMNKIAAFAGKKNLPIFIHLYSRKEILHFIKLINNYPETNFITAHLIGFEYFIKQAGHLRNLFFDISGSDLIREKHIREVIKVFGEGRVIFGTDMPFGKLEYNIEKVQKLGIPDDKKRMILGENIAGILNL